MQTVDTDIVVILISHFHYITSLFADLEVSIAFGVGKDFVYYSINSICERLVVRQARYLPCFMLSMDAILLLRSMAKECMGSFTIVSRSQNCLSVYGRSSIGCI